MLRTHLPFILAAIAVLLFVWAAGIAAGWVSVGTPDFLTNMGLASFAAAYATHRLP